MPRKLPSSTMLVKNVRKTTVDPNQRMHDSSKKRRTNPAKNSWRYGKRCSDDPDEIVTTAIAMGPARQGVPRGRTSEQKSYRPSVVASTRSTDPALVGMLSAAFHGL